MSNLRIEFTEFKILGCRESSVGFIATDETNETYFRSAKSWDEFRREFPTPQAVLDVILESPTMDFAVCNYDVVNGCPVWRREGDDEDDEVSTVDGLVFQGVAEVYGL
jgi:hypothetical protein